MIPFADVFVTCERIYKIAAFSSVKQSKMFTMQVDESTDISGKAQLIAFTRFVSDGKVSDRFFCCKESKERTPGQDTFDTLSKY